MDNGRPGAKESVEKGKKAGSMGAGAQSRESHGCGGAARLGRADRETRRKGATEAREEGEGENFGRRVMYIYMKERPARPECDRDIGLLVGKTPTSYYGLF